ncbi:hypothetical protein H632_c804p0, partial [Helicosporidium sp. ATCC 50920]
PPSRLAAVPHFVVGRKGLGEVLFLKPVDLRFADVAASVDIQRGRVSVRPVRRDGSAQARGTGINQPALLVFREMHVKGQEVRGRGLGGPAAKVRDGPKPRLAKPSEEDTLRFVARLKKASQDAGAAFVDYDVVDGVWTIKVDGF